MSRLFTFFDEEYSFQLDIQQAISISQKAEVLISQGINHLKVRSAINTQKAIQNGLGDNEWNELQDNSSPPVAINPATIFENGFSDLTDESQLRYILNVSSLKVDSEEQIIKHLLKHHLYRLLDCVKFESLVDIRFLSEIPYESLNSRIWRAIQMRLSIYRPVPSPRAVGERFVCSPGNELNGILRRCGRSWFEPCETNEPPNDGGSLLDWTEECAHGTDIENACLVISLEKNAKINGYTIQNHCGASHLRSWVVEVSFDNLHWMEVDSHVNSLELFERYAIVHFDFPETGLVKWVRIRMTDKSTRDDWAFYLSHVEIFGVLLE